tara:strand:+ start:8245 stop:8754 length:510 start_codon:yes stop_codon:yes gene_type:complete
MNFLKENKFAAITITLLVILNIALLSVFALPKLMHDSRGKDYKPGSFMADKVGLNQTQMAQYFSLQETHREKMDDLQSQINTKRKELFDLLKIEGNHTELVDSITSQIGTLSAETEETTYKHFASIRAICTPEQLVKLDNILKEAMRKRGFREDNNPRQQRERRSPRSN